MPLLRQDRFHQRKQGQTQKRLPLDKPTFAKKHPRWEGAPKVGYYSDFQGEIRATFADVDAACAALDELRKLAVVDKPLFAIMPNFQRDGALIVASVDVYEKWNTASVDVTALVQWLNAHGAADINGDIEVAGEEPRDLWRIHVADCAVTTQTGKVVYEEAS